MYTMYKWRGCADSQEREATQVSLAFRFVIVRCGWGDFSSQRCDDDSTDEDFS